MGYKPGDMVVYKGHRRKVMVTSGPHVVLHGSPPLTVLLADVERWEPPLMPGTALDVDPPPPAPVTAPVNRRVKAAGKTR